MSSDTQTDTAANPPSVLWAQRNGQILLTFNVQCENPDIQIKNQLVSFKGIGMPEQKLYQVEIPLYSEIDPDKSTYTNKSRIIEVILAKEKQDDGFWPYLTRDKKKYHWLKVDFNKWEDEDESDGEMSDILDGDIDVKDKLSQMQDCV